MNRSPMDRRAGRGGVARGLAGDHVQEARLPGPGRPHDGRQAARAQSAADAGQHAPERKLHRVGPNCETWPDSLTENPY